MSKSWGRGAKIDIYSDKITPKKTNNSLSLS